jgi:nucleoside-diphosphate-sugar epimerase
LKNHSNKKITIGYIGKKSVLAKSFINNYKKLFIFKAFKGDIRESRKLEIWLKKNKDINIFINFAAITSSSICQKFKKTALDVNYKSAVKLLDLLNKVKMNNFIYFLSLSTSHVFKKSNFKLTENSEKKPSTYYGFTKNTLEKYILKNQNNYTFKIGIARIFNYYNKGLKKGFFINDIVEKLKNRKMFIEFKDINTYRDFISMDDINTALLKMINLKLVNDYNICSGKKIYLPKIVNFLNKKFKNKIISFEKKFTYGLIGSNIKLKRKGWKIKNKDFLNGLLK